MLLFAQDITKQEVVFCQLRFFGKITQQGVFGCSQKFRCKETHGSGDLGDDHVDLIQHGLLFGITVVFVLLHPCENKGFLQLLPDCILCFQCFSQRRRIFRQTALV